LANVMQCADVRMIESRNGTRLTFEALAQIRI
jgi:hypothetical protein